ncbi:MAG: flagellin [Deltaproteobacteria bacterium]|nr:flagellin [Deltaproteobacteria bacterium]
MGLRINTNVAAINAHRQLLATDFRLSRNMQRLSSGFRINSAADDAAGLSIANRLRTNVRSLVVASRNVTEGKSMVNVAEGAANQVEGILERLKELATQAASDNAATDRTKINTEASTLIQEIDRIVNDTEYQGTILLKGTFGNAISSSSLTGAGVVQSDITVSGAQAGTYTFNYSGGNIALQGTNTTQTITLLQTASGAQTINFDKLGIVVKGGSAFDPTKLGDDSDAITVTSSACGGIFQVGSSNNNAADEIGLSLGDLRTSELGLTGADFSLLTRSDASDALVTIDNAIDTVNNKLGDMGAAINRLDYTYSNLQVSIENFQASESVIRDVDMAGEMVSFTKNQILLQAGTAMLAQANMSTQGVLTLMR